MRRLIDANELITALYHYEHEDGEIDAYTAQDIINCAPSIETKQIKYFDEEEKAWKIGDVIVEHTEQSQTGMPEYAPWKDAFDAMDCQSR